MDLSPLIFVGLAVAWAVYLVPKALKHHDEVQRSRSVERFSHTMRVLARREPVNRRDARLVLTPHRPASTPTVETKPTSSRPAAPVTGSVRRTAAAQAARRRRRVLGVLLAATLVVLGLAVGGVVPWPYLAVPGTTLVAWLVACRLMVRREQAVRSSVVAPVAEAPVDVPVWHEDAPCAGGALDSEPWVETPAEAPLAAPGSWDMVPVTLPTYVDKPAAAHRTVQTIDLESTGVWSSGRSEIDSALARESEQAERTSREQAQARRASGA